MQRTHITLLGFRVSQIQDAARVIAIGVVPPPKQRGLSLGKADYSAAKSCLAHIRLHDVADTADAKRVHQRCAQVDEMRITGDGSNIP